MKRFLILLMTSTMTHTFYAGEGMWPLLNIDSVKFREMQMMGLCLDPLDVYSADRPGLKDAVVIFGRGCTGALISPDGLVITNHHCGYSRILSHSTVLNDYLALGFWAGSKAGELPNPGLEVTFLVHMEDVSDKILRDIPDTLTEEARDLRVKIKASELQDEAVKDTHYKAEVKSFYFGKAYYLFIYEVFTDVRLVGAPPEAIGRFGGDTDNWVWPRHTGDFSLFRIYADKNNKPAPYSADNVPYRPRKFLKIAVDGEHEGDFTMILGYPGRTDEYLVSDALRMICEKALPAKIKMRSVRLDALKDEMTRSAAARLTFTGRYVSISNAWKKWEGVTGGIERSGALRKKELLEEKFETWANSLTDDTAGYSRLMDEFHRLYKQYEPLYLSDDLGTELMNSLEGFDLVDEIQTEWHTMLDSSEQYRQKAFQHMEEAARSYFRSNAVELDRRIMPSLMEIYARNTIPQYHPEFFSKVIKEFYGNLDAFIGNVFRQSIFTDSLRFMKALDGSPGVFRKKLETDPLAALYMDLSRVLVFDVYKKTDSLELELNRLYRVFLSGLMIMDTTRILYPDANFSMRLAYGKVEGYQASDAVRYGYGTTLNGIIEKEDPDISDYQVPESLKVLFRNRDYGPYASQGQLPVCFTASNHTSGGNSGSPVINAEGNLIGINFDRNWEGTVSDYSYDPAFCRNIALDMRYVLFIIDKLAGADWLLDEMTILKN